MVNKCKFLIKLLLHSDFVSAFCSSCFSNRHLLNRHGKYTIGDRLWGIVRSKFSVSRLWGVVRSKFSVS